MEGSTDALDSNNEQSKVEICGPWIDSVEQLLNALYHVVKEEEASEAALLGRLDEVVSQTRALMGFLDVNGRSLFSPLDRVQLNGVVATCFGTIDWLAGPFLDPQEWEGRRQTWLECLPKVMRGRVGTDCLYGPLFSHVEDCRGPKNLLPTDNGCQILAAYQLYMFDIYVKEGSGLFGCAIVLRIRHLVAKILGELLADGQQWPGFRYKEIEAGKSLLEDILKPKNFDLAEYFTGVAPTNGIARKEIEEKAAEKKLLAVGTWAGEICVPSFQFDTEDTKELKDFDDLVEHHLKEKIQYMLNHTLPYYQGWPLAVFAHRHQSLSLRKIRERLEGTSVYKQGEGKIRRPDTLAKKATDCVFDVVLKRLPQRPADDLVKLEPGQKWYNAHPCCFPLDEEGAVLAKKYFFSKKIAAGKQGKPLSARFNIDVNGRGTMYLAEDLLGSVKECLRHDPVLTLRELGSWNYETFTVTEDMDRNGTKLCNIVGLLEWKDISRAGRKATQGHAKDVAKRGFAGIYYGLKQALGLRGLALFGPSGARDDDLPGWHSDTEPLINSDDLWLYIETCKPDFDDVLLTSVPPLVYGRLSLYRTAYRDRPEFFNMVLERMEIPHDASDEDIPPEKYIELADCLG